MVDPQWLAGVRSKNRERFGLEGMGDLGAYQSAQDLVAAINVERGVRMVDVHRGRFEERDPLRPTEGSAESIAAAIGPGPVAAMAPASRSVSPTVLLVGTVLGLGAFGLLAYSIWKD